MKTKEDVVAALKRVAWMADAGRQFVSPDPAVYRELFEHIRDYARQAARETDDEFPAGVGWTSRQAEKRERYADETLFDDDEAGSEG